MLKQLCRFSIEVECNNSKDISKCKTCGWNPKVIPKRKKEARKNYYNSLEKTEYFLYPYYGGIDLSKK